MKRLINRRSGILFLVNSAALIAITSFIYGYTDSEVSFLSPFFVVLTAGITTLLLETWMQRQAQ